jgi:hypothetical protein
VAWGSHRQTCTVTSTTEAEYVAATDATKEAIWLRRLLIQIDSFLNNHVRSLCDNQSSIRLVHNPIHHSRTKHIQIRYHFIREKQEEGEIGLCHHTSSRIFLQNLYRLLN